MFSEFGSKSSAFIVCCWVTDRSYLVPHLMVFQHAPQFLDPSGFSLGLTSAGNSQWPSGESLRLTSQCSAGKEKDHPGPVLLPAAWGFLLKNFTHAAFFFLFLRFFYSHKIHRYRCTEASTQDSTPTSDTSFPYWAQPVIRVWVVI